MVFQAAVAQLDRVLGYEPRGRGFDSCQPHQIEQGFASKDANPFSFAPHDVLPIALGDRDFGFYLL